MASKTLIQKRRRLADLYMDGTEVRFNQQGVVNAPPEGEEPEGWEPPERVIRPSEDDIVVYVTQPNPHQKEQALREAQAVRSRTILRAKRDEDSEEAVSIQASIAELTDDELVAFILEMGGAERYEEAVRDVRASDEWEDFDSLRDAIRQWEEEGWPETEEWKPLIERDVAFREQVNERTNQLLDSSRESLLLQPRDSLEKKAFDRRMELLGSQAFLEEFEIQMLFYACRDDSSRDVLFFDNPKDLLSQDEKVQTALREALERFVNEEREAKNSRRAASGSSQSELPSEPETSVSSTPQAPSA